MIKQITRNVLLPSALCAAFLLGFASFASASTVWLTDLNAEVTSGRVESLVADFAAAEQAGAELVVLRIDTPGGMLEPTRVLIQAILDSPVPIVGYVTPAGARASSAGTYILAATHVAAMAPATNVGSAKPVFIGFGEIDEDAKLKATNDASAQMRALAQLRNRNADWLEQSVVAAKNITAEEALGLGVIDLIAVNQKDLLKQLQGRRVQMGEADLVLETTDLEAKEGTPFESVSWPTIWLLFGIALIVLELLLTSFISLFFGLGALITALALTLGLPASGWPVWSVFWVHRLSCCLARERDLSIILLGMSLRKGILNWMQVSLANACNMCQGSRLSNRAKALCSLEVRTGKLGVRRQSFPLKLSSKL